MEDGMPTFGEPYMPDLPDAGINRLGLFRNVGPQQPLSHFHLPWRSFRLGGRNDEGSWSRNAEGSWSLNDDVLWGRNDGWLVAAVIPEIPKGLSGIL